MLINNLKNKQPCEAASTDIGHPDIIDSINKFLSNNKSIAISKFANEFGLQPKYIREEFLRIGIPTDLPIDTFHYKRILKQLSNLIFDARQDKERYLKEANGAILKTPSEYAKEYGYRTDDVTKELRDKMHMKWIITNDTKIKVDDYELINKLNIQSSYSTKLNTPSQTRISSSQRKVPEPDIAQELLILPYKSEFVRFGSNSKASVKSTSEKKECIIYTNQNAEELGRVFIQNNRIVAATNRNEYGDIFIKRSESFLSSGLLKERRLCVFYKGRYHATLLHFCYELYNKNGQMEFCTTSINDSSISNHEGDFVRYIYDNGQLNTKEIYSGKQYRWGQLGSNSYMPPVITSTGGTLKIRYTRNNNCLIKESGFERTDAVLLIIDNKNGAEKFVKLGSPFLNRDIITETSILNDTMCRVHIQEKLFMSTIQDELDNSRPFNF